MASGSFIKLELQGWTYWIMAYIIPHSMLRLFTTHFDKRNHNPFYSYRKLSLKYPYCTISKSSMLDCVFEQTFVTAGRNGYTL